MAATCCVNTRVLYCCSRCGACPSVLRSPTGLPEHLLLHLTHEIRVDRCRTLWTSPRAADLPRACGCIAASQLRGATQGFLYSFPLFSRHPRATTKKLPARLVSEASGQDASQEAPQRVVHPGSAAAASCPLTIRHLPVFPTWGERALRSHHKRQAYHAQQACQ